MSDKLKLFGFLLLSAIVLIFGAGLLGGIIGYDKGKTECVTIVETDTVVETNVVYVQSPPDTVILTKLVKIKVPVLVTDSSSAPVDSAEVELPMEWHLASVPDTADVWYHGILAAVDSMRFYTHNTVITNTVIVPEKTRNNLVGASAGLNDAALLYMHDFGRLAVGASAGYTYKGQPTARAVVGFKF